MHSLSDPFFAGITLNGCANLTGVVLFVFSPLQVFGSASTCTVVPSLPLTPPLTGRAELTSAYCLAYCLITSGVLMSWWQKRCACTATLRWDCCWHMLCSAKDLCSLQHSRHPTQCSLFAGNPTPSHGCSCCCGCVVPDVYVLIVSLPFTTSGVLRSWWQRPYACTAATTSPSSSSASVTSLPSGACTATDASHAT
jgi:hypothetical protein